MRYDYYPTYRIVCPDGLWELTTARYAEMDRDNADRKHDTCRRGRHLIQVGSWKTVEKVDA